MYTLKRAYGIEYGYNKLWNDQVIDNFKLFELFQIFRDLYLDLENPFITGNVFVQLKDIEQDYNSSQLTLNELFTSNPNLVLPTVSSIPRYEQKRIRYSDAIREGYKLDIAAPGYAPGSNVLPITKTEVTIKREATSNKDLYDYCLFTINGYLHSTDYDNKFLYVVDGAKSLKKSRKNTAGILSFERIGKVTQKPITVNDISKTAPDIPLYQKVFITIPQEFIGQSIMLSIGGYLVIPEPNTFYPISDNLWILNLEKLDTVGRYFESRNYLDYTDLGLTTFPEDKDKVSLVELQSDEVITKYLTLKNSFFIAVNVPNLVYEKKFVRHSSIANQYLAYKNPTQPLFLGRGRQADYWKEQDEGVWSITVENGFKPRLIFDNLDNNSHPFDSGAVTPYNIYENSRAFLLDMVADIQVE